MTQITNTNSHETNEFNKQREIRGYSILAKGDQPVMVNETEYLVPSQSNETKKYKITHVDGWTCDCLDFKNRCAKQGLFCKHIKSIQFYLKLRNKTELDTLNFDEEINEEFCSNCKSNNIVKFGVRKNKKGIVQRYSCKDCNKTFVLEPLKYVKANSKLIMLTMDLYYKGLSLRDISDTMKQFYGLKVTHETIRLWIQKFTKLMSDYTDKFKPHVGRKWQTDEQKVKSNGKWVWSWNVLDEDTRFLIANTVTKGRTVSEAREVFKKARDNTNELPLEVRTDGLWSYRDALKKELLAFKGRTGRTQHIRNVGIAKGNGKNNNKVERYHGQFREFDKVRRGFKSDLTTKEWTEGFRLFHNFIRKGKDGLTPSERAKIPIMLSDNRWLNLLKNSLGACNCISLLQRDVKYI